MAKMYAHVPLQGCRGGGGGEMVDGIGWVFKVVWLTHAQRGPPLPHVGWALARGHRDSQL